jgi:cytochrome c peroxidase
VPWWQQPDGQRYVQTLHDIGTLTPSSGRRPGDTLTGIDTPTLRGVWASAPYLHNGSAATLRDAVSAHEGITVTPFELAVELSATAVG